jgi:hypothetical protein
MSGPSRRVGGVVCSKEGRVTAGNMLIGKPLADLKIEHMQKLNGRRISSSQSKIVEHIWLRDGI